MFDTAVRLCCVVLLARAIIGFKMGAEYDRRLICMVMHTVCEK